MGGGPHTHFMTPGTLQPIPRNPNGAGEKKSIPAPVMTS